MNWDSFRALTKYIFKNINQVHPINSWRAQYQNPDKGLVILNQNTNLALAPGSLLRVTDGVSFYFNRYWHQKDSFPGMLMVQQNGVLDVNGDFSIYSGARLVVNENARLVLGSGYINHGLNLNCFTSIQIGHNVAISEQVTIRDSDNHQMVAPNYQNTLPIKIEDNVWIGMNVTILKGVTIGQGAVIAAGSVVNKNVPARCLAGGVPARILKENIEWQ